ncbi:MAG TPA: HlyD family secretion protein [Bauldia sp.]|nr:HlyD family secretion protein [Bauldia sp.]
MSADGGDNRPAAARPAGAAPAMQAQPPAPPKPEEPPKRNNRRRYILMASVPVVLILIGGYFWLTGGKTASTDNAYVQQDRVTVTAQVSGKIVAAPVHENDVVKAGDILFKIDDAPYKIALASAEAGLASARLQVEELRAAENAAVAAEKAASDDVDFNQKNFDRVQGLLGKGVASQAQYDQSEQNLHNAQQALEQAKEREESSLSALGGNASIKTEDHPMVQAAQARRDQAALDLSNTTVTAPADGVVAQSDRLLLGQQITPAIAVMSLVETSSSYVEANFKETDLTKMVAGQKAKVSIDAYPGHEFEATVASIGAGTGAEFSLLPAQNATGNWVKVVQRVPVRVTFTGPLTDLPALRTGLSASVSVDLTSTPTRTAAN